MLFKRHLRVYFDFPSKTQRPSPPLLPEIQRKKQPNPPLKDLFFARKSYHFYVPKMSLKNANGCSVCAWLLTSGGLRLTLRLTPQRHPRASPSAETPKGAPSAELQATPSRGRRPSAHTSTDKSTAEPLNFLSHKSNENMKLVCGTKSAAGSGAVPADPLGIGCRFSPPRARFSYTFA